MNPDDIAALAVFFVAFVIFVLIFGAIYLMFEVQVARSYNKNLESRIAWMQREIEQQQETIRLLRDERPTGVDRLFIQ